MSDQPVRWTPLGNLDKDTEYKLVGKGNYTDALDIIKQDDAGQVSGTIQPTKRNKHAFSLGSVQAQNKKYRVTVSGDATKSHALKFLSTKRDASVVNGNGSDNELLFNGTVSDLLNAWNTQTQQFTSFQVTSTGNSVEFEMLGYPYYNWYLESVGEDDVEVVCIQEAIPIDLAGPLKDIGSYDLLGDLFVFSTTQDNEPTELEAEIIGVGPIGPNPTPPPNNLLVGPLTSLIFNEPHGLQEGQWIRITDSNAPWLNGVFVVQNVTSTIGVEIVTDTAWGATHPTFTVGQEKVFIHPTGIGEIGVAQKNNSTESWTYTRLLRSVEFNFVSKHSIDCFLDNSKEKIASYYTDNYNRPGVFYYYGSYETDGALNGLNIYSYESIYRETSLQNPSQSASIDFVNQTNSGGNLAPGVKRYAFILYTLNGDQSPISSFTAPIIVYKTDDIVSSVTYSNEIIGQSTTDNNSTKKNVIKISNIDSNVYSSGKIICIEFISGVLVSNVISEFNISNSEYTYEHTGFEELEQIDIGEVFSSSSFSSISSIVKAKSIRSIDSRNVLSNITSYSDIDFSVFTEAIKHELIYDEFDESTLKNVGENQDVFVFKDKSGLMLNETYRFGCRVHIPGFGWSSYYWIDDIIIDTNSINTASPYNDNRRVSGLPDFNLTNGGLIDEMDNLDSNPNARKTDGAYFNSNGSFITTQNYVGVYRKMYNGAFALSGPNGYNVNCKYRSPKVKFHIDWDYFIDGIGFLNSVVDSIEFGIGNINNSIKASGMGVLSCSVPEASFQNSYFADSSIFQFPFNPYNTFKTLPITEQPSSIVDRDLIPNYPFIYNGGDDIIKCDEIRNVITFYSPESIIEGEAEISSSDKVIALGSMQTYKQISGRQYLGNNDGYFTIFQPYGDDDFQYKTTHNIETSSFISDEGSASVSFPNGETFKVKSSADLLVPDMNDTPGNQDVYNYRIRNYKSSVFKLDSDIPNYTETHITKQQRGVIYCQLFNDESNSYPQIRDTSYRKIGSTIFFNSIPNSEIIVNGGDTITSLFFFKEFSELNTDYTLNQAGDFSGTLKLQGSMIGLVCQTRKNVKALNGFEAIPEKKVYPFQYGYGSYNFNQTIQPVTTVDVERNVLNRWRQHPNSAEINNIYEENIDYAINNNLLNSYLYSSFQYQGLISNANSSPCKIQFSERKIENSRVDYYRVFLPVSYKELDSVFGEIIHHEDINGELFTIQPRKYQLQYFNTRGTLQGSNEGVEVLIGDASVLGRDGQTLSSYGTQHKWSVVKGSSPGGKDVIYWFNQENGLFMRFGADGTVVLSERHGMRSFSANNTNWTENQHTPALNYGIRSVWDDRFKEAIWTFIGLRSSRGEWGTLPSNQLYAEGDTVTNNTFINYPFDGVPDVYVSLSLHAPIPQSEPGVGNDWETYWRRVDKDDPEYYSVFTLAFNELSNGFSTFYSHLPKTYLKWKNKFLSSHPTERSEIYEHRYGYDKWYEYEGAWKESEPFLEGVVNPFPDQSKKFVAIQSLSDNVPDRIELKTKDHESFLVSADFDPEDDAWRTPIKNDILTSQTGDPNDDTESLVGSYMRIKFKFFNGAYNKLNNLIVKVRQRLRRT
jgi:hypothetical protein